MLSKIVENAFKMNEEERKNETTKRESIKYTSIEK